MICVALIVVDALRVGKDYGLLLMGMNLAETTYPQYRLHHILGTGNQGFIPIEGVYLLQ